MLRSFDGGKWCEGPVYPPHIPPEAGNNTLRVPLPACKRGALCEGKSGSIFWVVTTNGEGKTTSTHLLVSGDKRLTWNYSCPVASDSSVSFNETSFYETPKGDLVAFRRTEDYKDQSCIARSANGGKSFGKWELLGFQGHPLNALRLPDNRVLLIYGYRHKPYGIRDRILNPECSEFLSAPEIGLHDYGGNPDLRYTWPVLLDKDRVLVVYYFNQDNGTRYIADTIPEIE